MSKNFEDMSAAAAYGLHAMAHATGQTPEDILRERGSSARSSRKMRTGNAVENVQQTRSGDSDDWDDDNLEPPLDEVFS